MNFKSLALKAAVAATVLTGSTLAVSPAEAITVGSRLNFSGDADATPTDIDFYLLNGNRDGNGGTDIGRFRVGSVASNTGEFSSLATERGRISDLTGIISASATNPPVFQAVNNFLFFGTNSPFNFKLTAFTYVNDLKYTFAGIFDDGTSATGELTTQIIAAGPNSYSVTVIAGDKIPTPALLPGLIGMGAAVLRKRKAEETQQAEAEV